MSKWITRKIMPDVMKAIEATDRFTYVFYITSKGGEGKTVLLRQIGAELGSPDGISPNFPWSGILDLYHSGTNTNSGLEAHLSQALETDDKEFQPYRDERDAYAARRMAGLVGSELEKERERMAEVFAECVNEVTRWSRVVIALDTTERIQYEVDEVQKLCQMEDESTTVRAWLLDQLRRWENCVVLLVGRPEADPYLGKALEETLTTAPGVRYKAMTLGGFDAGEVREYFAQKESEFSAVREFDPEFRHRLWEVTGGSPIRLDLAIEVVRHWLGFDQFREEIMKGSVEDVREQLDRLLIEHVLSGDPDDPVHKALRYLAAARKGLEANLLHHLAGEWDLNECQAHLSAVAELGFVKRHPEDKRLFLHDEMYLLCDTYLFKPEEVQRLSQRIVDWYEDRKGDGKERQQDLLVDSLLYRLRANPREGYRWYARQAEFAIRAVEAGFDMRLRSEVMALLKSESPVDKRLLRDAPGLVEEFNCDGAARWVKRLMVRGKNKEAVEIAEKTCPIFCPADDSAFKLAKADIAVYQAQAMIYTGRAREALDLLKGVIANIEGESKPEELASHDAESYDGWRRNMVLGRTHNNLGYAYWMHFGHYEAALKEFRAAIPYFHASELKEELANTNDNMGRVYALRRHPTRAETLVDEGLALRRELGRDYRIALSLNSRAVVCLEFEEPHRARRLGEEALGIFEGLGAQRGIGLALVTLGRSLRHLGNLWIEGVYSFKDCDQFFRDGADCLDRAIYIFEHRVDEPVRLVEALNELGCVYRDRAGLAGKMSSDSPLAKTIALEAIKRLERCIELADSYQFSVQFVDACEDLASTYLLRHHYDNVRLWLDHAEERVPDVYKFKVGQTLPQIPAEERVEAFWLQMGKIELLHGSLVFDLGTDSGTRPATREVLRETAEHYLLSAAYFEKYSDRAVGLKDTFRQMYVRFKFSSLEDLGYMQKEMLPALADKYSINLTRLGRFFEDTLGLALEWQP
jgi:tetratricopeptide (TPR) repeat protein